jgi:hypothetical protein
MKTERPMTDRERSYGTFTIGVLAAMLGTGIAWARGLGLLPGLGWGLIACVVGVLVGTVIYFVVVE